MDFDVLPMELLQKILSYLSYEDLLIKSLVCHRWKLAADLIIVRQGRLRIRLGMVHKLEALAESSRNHLTVAITGMDEWETLRRIVDVCRERFTPRQIDIMGVLADHLYRFYQTYRSWLEEVEVIHIGLDDRFTEHLTYGAKDYSLSLPNLKHLLWNECLYGSGEKTVTIDAPKLQTVMLDDSLDATAVLKIPNCDKLERVKCQLYLKHFDDTFTGSFSNLEVLILDFANDNYDLTFIGCMRKLRWLELAIYHTEPSFASLESINNCKSLEGLRIRVKDLAAQRASLDLSRITQPLTKLRQIELSGLDLIVSGLVKMDCLSFLKLKDVRFCDSNFVLPLDASKLETLSIPIRVLSRTFLNNDTCLVRLYVDMGTLSLKESFDAHLNPFLQIHKSVRELTLLNPNYNGGICDNNISSGIVLAIERLELRTLGVSMDFFRHISRWKSLKHLSLIACTIGCKGINDTVHLSGLKTMHIDFVKLNGSNGTRFPLVLDVEGSSEIISQRISNTVVFKTKSLTHTFTKEAPFGPYLLDPI